MRYLKEKTMHQIEINKSVFIAVLYPLDTKTEVSTYIDKTKQVYPKANHYCSASIFGETGEHQSANDDGEPSRTAGIPILEVLKHHGVTNTLCVVVRYFGGIKLGAGGLIRAYTKATAEVMKKSLFYTKKMVPSYRISFDYQWIDSIDHYFEKKATVIKKDFLTTVTYHIVLHDADVSIMQDIRHQLIECQQLEQHILWIKT